MCSGFTIFSAMSPYICLAQRLLLTLSVEVTLFYNLSMTAREVHKSIKLSRNKKVNKKLLIRLCEFSQVWKFKFRESNNR